MDIHATDLGQAKRFIRQLALEWIQGRLPSHELTFVDCLNTLTHLQSVIQDIDRTTLIFDVVFKQANDLKKSSEWLGTELQFEAVAQLAPNREALLLLYLEHCRLVDDEALDLYNERVNRFPSMSRLPI